MGKNKASGLENKKLRDPWVVRYPRLKLESYSTTLNISKDQPEVKFTLRHQSNKAFSVAIEKLLCIFIIKKTIITHHLLQLYISCCFSYLESYAFVTPRNSRSDQKWCCFVKLVTWCRKCYEKVLLDFQSEIKTQINLKNV